MVIYYTQFNKKGILKMKNIIIVIIAIIAINCKAVEVKTKLLNAIKTVESNGKSDAIGDNGKAVGAYQLWKTYVDDVNNILKNKGSKIRFTYNDRFNAHKSRVMTLIYLKHYGKVYERKTGKVATDEILAKIHNGGPNGWKKQATEKYWNKIKAELK